MADYHRFAAFTRRCFSVIATRRKRALAAPRGRASSHRYGEGLGATEADAGALAEEAGDALPDALGAAEKLGSGAGVGEGKSVVGTLARERAKIRMKMTRTISTHGRASVSLRGGSEPR